MAKAVYYGVMHKDKGSDYGVSFPDFPGCVTADADFEGALAAARQVLAFHIAGMVEDGEILPEPSKIEDIKAADKPVAIVPVMVEVPSVRVKRYNIAARPEDIKRVDQFLKEQGRSRDRSEFLIGAALHEIERIKKKKAG